jgi:hypothetical protein
MPKKREPDVEREDDDSSDETLSSNENEDDGRQPFAPEEDPDDGDDQVEKTVADVVYEAYLKFDTDRKQLDADAVLMTEEIDEIREMIYPPQSLKANATKPAWLEKSDVFKTHLDHLAKGIGQALEYVRMMEKTKKNVTPDSILAQVQPESVEDEERSAPVQMPQQPVNVFSGNMKGGGGGLGGFLAARENRKMVELYLQSQKTVESPVVTVEQVQDIVDYGKQLLPAINQVKNWLPGTLAECALFPDVPTLWWVFNEELSCHLGKYFGTLEAFCKAYTQYLKGVIDGRSVSMAKSLARIAEAQSMGGGGGASVQKGGTFMSKGAELAASGFQARKQ